MIFILYFPNYSLKSLNSCIRKTSGFGTRDAFMTARGFRLGILPKEYLMRGWMILYAFLSAASLSAFELGFTSWGVRSLGVVAMTLTLLTLFTTAVRGRA